MRRDTRAKGFTLIELLIVVAIILIIAGFAIPKLNKAKMSANETSAIASLRTITTASIQYYSTYGNGFAPNLGALGGSSSATTSTCDAALLLGSDLSNNGVGNTASKSGYTITYVPGTAIATPPPGCTNPGTNSYAIYAVPTEVGSTGQRGFFVDSSGTIRFSADGSIPTTANPALQ